MTSAGKLYEIELGMPIQNFASTTATCASNSTATSANTKREGLSSSLATSNKSTTTAPLKRVAASEQPYGPLYPRRRKATSVKPRPPTAGRADKTSNLNQRRPQLGLVFRQYPFYSDDDTHQLESDIPKLSLPEIILPARQSATCAVAARATPPSCSTAYAAATIPKVHYRF